jgi:hypothetical protein
VASKSFINGRGATFCRGCLGDKLFSALDLGNLPIANELLLTTDTKVEKFPLHLRICSDCGLGQVADVVTPERIFRDYRYLSSLSTTFVKHASDFVTQLIQRYSFSKDDWVLEIASNDGYLLKNFIPLGIKVIGVEPAENVAKISRSLGIETISEFFSSELASGLLIQHGHPKIIIANNVMAHVPDLNDFVKGLSLLAGPQTKISIENPSLINVLLDLQFDTIYHEHYSYLSASAVDKISQFHGLELFSVVELPIHGGSNRYWLQKQFKLSTADQSVSKLKKFEKDIKLFEESSWLNFSLTVSSVLLDFQNWLTLKDKQDRRIYGYGAAAKASTILNSIDASSSELVLGIADLSQEKHGRFMPAYGNKVITIEELVSSNPTDIVIFPWNIKNEIANQLRTQFDESIRLWCAIPSMHEVI